MHSREHPGRRLADRFEEQARVATDNRQLGALLAAAAAELGFQCFALVHHAALEGPRPGLINIHNYPSAWERELGDGALAYRDPVHRACLRSSAGFQWSELATLVQMGSRDRDMLERAKGHGILDGFTVPVNVPGEPSGSCSFAVGPGRHLPLSRLRCAEQVGFHAFKSARAINNLPVRGDPPRLSPRERQCVALIAGGKTDWEMAAILSLSIETVHQYVKRARAAYNVVSRAQLVACGLRDSIVSFTETIPPDG